MKLTKSANNKVNERLNNIFKTNKHEDFNDHPQNNKWICSHERKLD